MSQVTPETNKQKKKTSVLGDLGVTVWISFIFGAGRVPGYAAITIVMKYHVSLIA